MRRTLLLVSLICLIAACGPTTPAPATARPSPVERSAAPVRASTHTVADTSTPAPANTPTQEPTATSIPIQVAPGSTEVVYHSGQLELRGFLCIPDGVAPFPAVVYHHGGMGEQIGGAPAETCEALARDGFVGFSPIRRPTKPLAGHLDDVLAAVDYVKNLGYVDSSRVGIMGFSRGGFLTFMAATDRPDDFRAIVIMASAVEILEGHLPRASKISAPALLLISANDNARQNHVQAMQQLREALESAGKQVEFILYPPYGNDGHRMFFEVGDYWHDVRQFLRQHLMRK